MSCLSLGNCESCWDDPCTCGKKGYSDTSLSFLRTDELLALKAKIENIITARNQSVSYATHTEPRFVSNSRHTVVLRATSGNPFEILNEKHKD